jgi:ribosomal protein S6
MKRVFMTAVLFVAFSTVFANDLNSNAKVIKEALPEVYAKIKSMAVDKWGTDYDMVVYTINKESDSYFYVYDFYSSNKEDEDLMTIFDKALLKWSNFKSGDKHPLLTGDAQWGMVEYTIKKQVKSYSALNNI